MENIANIERAHELYRILGRRYVLIPVQSELLRRDNQANRAERPGHIPFQL